VKLVDGVLAQLRAAIPIEKKPIVQAAKVLAGSQAVASEPIRALDLKNAEILFPKEPLSAEASLQDLRDWMEKFEAFFATANAELAPITTQRRLILQAMDATLAEYLRITCDKEKPVYGTGGLVEALQARFLELNPRFKRLREILTAEQPSGLNFSVWMTKLENASREAKLDKVTDEDLLCFALMSSCRDQRLKAKLLKFTTPTVAKLRAEVVAYEVVNKNATSDTATTSILNVEEAPSYAIAAAPQRPPQPPYQRRPQGQQGQGPAQQGGQRPPGQQRYGQPSGQPGGQRQQQPRGSACRSCGELHTQQDRCFAQNAKCFYCKSMGHFKSKRGDRDYVLCPALLKKANTNAVVQQQEAETVALPDLSILTVGKGLETVTLSCRIQNRHFSLQAVPDTGAAITVISEKEATLANLFISTKGKIPVLTSANGGRLTVLGAVEFVAKLPIAAEFVLLRAVVIRDLCCKMLVSTSDLKRLQILPRCFPNAICVAKENDINSNFESNVNKNDSLEQIQKDFADVFVDDLGEAGGSLNQEPPMRIHIDPNTKVLPIRVTRSRQTPVHIQPAAAKLVQELIKGGVFEPVDYPTEWCSPAHFLDKGDGRARMVIDYRRLNLCIKRPHHPFPSSLDLIQKIPAGSKFFAKLDAVHGYFQVPLDERDRDLTCCLIPGFGRGRMCVAPMGLNPSSDEFCRRTDSGFMDLFHWLLKIVDDLCVCAPNMETLLVRLRLVLTRCRAIGLKISKKKFHLGESVKFAGYNISGLGVKMDVEKVRAIKDFPVPKSTTDMRSFMGLVNQFCPFSPEIAKTGTTLRQLVSPKVPFVWLPEHQQEFEALKSLLLKTTQLIAFDPLLPTELLTDAARLHGLGFALIQRASDGSVKLVYCGSKSLSPAERNYSMVELELLAIVWAVKKCHYYLKGIPKFTVVTDHKPLEGIFRKDLQEIDNPRLVRFREFLIPYPLNVHWTEGKKHLIADALSRAPVDPPEHTIAAIEQKVSAPLLNPFFEKLDVEYGELIESIRAKTDVTESLSIYKPVWERLSVATLDTGKPIVILDGTRVVVPGLARPTIMELVHKSHAGITKTLLLANAQYYWPGMRNSLVQKVKTCAACSALLASKPVEKFLPIPVSRPWSHGSADLADINAKSWLVYVDRLSGFPLAAQLTKTTTKHVTDQLRGWFCEYGFPTHFRSDNGPQFRSQEFKEFCVKYGITHETSAAYNPRGNGLAENAVKQVKHLVRKCQTTGEDFRLALLEWRNVPRADGISPAMIVFGRQQKSLLPCLPDVYKSRNVDTLTQERLRSQQSASSERSKDKEPREEFSVGTKVNTKTANSKIWQYAGEVVELSHSGRSLWIQNDEGFRTRVNRRQCRSTTSSQ